MAYRVEYASTGRSGCKGPKACKEAGESNKIAKGELRLGSVAEIQGHTSFFWRHYGCITDTICSNLKEKLEEPDNLDGYEELTEEDQERIKYLFEHGHIPEDQITPAVKEENERKEHEKEEKEAAKQRAKDEKAAEKAAKKAATASKKRKKAAADDDDEPSVAGEDVEEAPTKKRGRAVKSKAEDHEPSTSASPAASTSKTSSRSGRAAARSKKSKAESTEDDEFDSFAPDARASPHVYSPSPSDLPPAYLSFFPPPISNNGSAPPTPTRLSVSDHLDPPAAEMLEDLEPMGPQAPAPSYNAASLLSYLRESLASSPLASGYRALNGQLRIHALFSTPRLARDLFPLAHLDLSSPESQAGQRQAVEAYLEHILVTVSFSSQSPSRSPTSNQHSQSSHASHDESVPQNTLPKSSTSTHQMTLALECFLYTIPAHRAAILYVSKLDSTGLGPSCPGAALVPFMSEESDRKLDGQNATAEGGHHPSTTLTRAVTTAFISYFASFQHWLPPSGVSSASSDQNPFPFPPRLEKTLAARREALSRSPVRHLSVHVLARAQRCYLFPDSNLNPAKRVLSDGGLIRWWRRTLSDAIFATRFEHNRVLQESGGPASEMSKLNVAPFYLIPGYSKYESHPIVPIPSVPTFINVAVTRPSGASTPRRIPMRTGLYPSWAIPRASNEQQESTSQATTGPLNTASPDSATLVRNISALWEKLGKLDEKGSLADARWCYGHPYSPEGSGISDPAMSPVLPLYHPVPPARTRKEGRSVVSSYDSNASERGWRSIATLLPHFEDDPKSRFVDEIARDAHEHAGSGLRLAAMGSTHLTTAPSTASQTTSEGVGSGPSRTRQGSSTTPEQSPALALSVTKAAAAKSQKVIHAASDATASPVQVQASAPEGIQNASAQTAGSATTGSTGPANPSAARRNAALRSQLLERAALDNISATEFWERMGFRQECCSGNAVGVFVVLFTLEDPLSAGSGQQDYSKTLPPATAPVPQPLALPHPSIPDMVLSKIMRDACDWSNSESAAELTQAWGEAVHKTLMRKGNVRKYLASTLAAANSAAAPSTSPSKTAQGPSADGSRSASNSNPSPRRSPLRRTLIDSSSLSVGSSTPSLSESPFGDSSTATQVNGGISSRNPIRRSTSSHMPAWPSIISTRRAAARLASQESSASLSGSLDTVDTVLQTLQSEVQKGHQGRSVSRTPSFPEMRSPQLGSTTERQTRSRSGASPASEQQPSSSRVTRRGATTIADGDAAKATQQEPAESTGGRNGQPESASPSKQAGPSSHGSQSTSGGGPQLNLQHSPSDEPGWVGYNTIWTTVNLHGPPAHVVARAKAKYEEATVAAKRKLQELNNSGEAGGTANTGPEGNLALAAAEAAGVKPAAPVTMLTVRKKKKVAD
ncbi:hypothetical protein OC846_006388 [Tilletia horrida]|uniref:histone acetyltransferase n=1 Tax=Tilletia horrida TaxID=155126 RepID=A0AAN6JPD9_9BASI|nr:hypothetical protein OC846_006388 [Tilletia horrida]KAK0559910.1 hypothetical protein OC861_006479 [Tilletia horrida]